MTNKVVAPVFLPMSVDQAGRIADRFITKARADGGNLPHATVQSVLEEEGDALVEEMFKALRSRVECRADEIVRPFKVDRTKSPEQLYVALGRVEWYVDREVLKTLPTDGPAEGELVFFSLRRDTPVAEIHKVLAERNLVPDYAAQMQVNADDPVFADEHPNGMQWGKNSCVYFDRNDGEREVSVFRRGSDWRGHIWFAGRRK